MFSTNTSWKVMLWLWEKKHAVVKIIIFYWKSRYMSFTGSLMNNLQNFILLYKIWRDLLRFNMLSHWDIKCPPKCSKNCYLERKGFTYCNQSKLEKYFKSILNYDFVPYSASATAEEKPQYQTKWSSTFLKRLHRFDFFKGSAEKDFK